MRLRFNILKLFLLLAFACLSGAASAQKAGIVRFWNRLCEPNPRLDSVYIFQPYKGWGVSAGYELEGHNVSLDTKIDYEIDDTRINFQFLLGMDPMPDHKIGLYGYAGPVRLGFSQEVGAMAGNGRTFSLRLMGNSLAADVVYTRFHFRSGSKDYYGMGGAHLAMSQSGEFSNLTVALQVMYKF